MESIYCEVSFDLLCKRNAIFFSYFAIFLDFLALFCRKIYMNVFFFHLWKKVSQEKGFPVGMLLTPVMIMLEEPLLSRHLEIAI